MATVPDSTKVIFDRRAIILLTASFVPVLGVFLIVDPYPQPASYHDFADDRTVFGIANFWNVASNALFLVFGMVGLRQVASGNNVSILPELRSAYVVLFAGLALTALGSGWFHLEPNNNSLFWDRLPMTIAFMSLFAIIVGEHVSAKLGSYLLWPLLVLGSTSVLYWDYTESLDAGDLRLYGLVQFLPLVLFPAILVLYESAFDRTRFLWLAMGCYVLAKLFEYFDVLVFDLGQLVSGHSVKHVAASLVPLILINGMRKRKRNG